MSYRKLDIDGTVYEYVIGKHKIKIKGVGVFDTWEVGYGLNKEEHTSCITPRMVKDFIQNIDSDRYRLYLKSQRLDWDSYHERIMELVKEIRAS